MGDVVDGVDLRFRRHAGRCVQCALWELRIGETERQSRRGQDETISSQCAQSPGPGSELTGTGETGDGLRRGSRPLTYRRAALPCVTVPAARSGTTLPQPPDTHALYHASAGWETVMGDVGSKTTSCEQYIRHVIAIVLAGMHKNLFDDGR